MAEWISILDKLPSDNELVWAADDLGHVYRAVVSRDDGRIDWWGFGVIRGRSYWKYDTAEVTRWMPITDPEAPSPMKKRDDIKWWLIAGGLYEKYAIANKQRDFPRYLTSVGRGLKVDD